MSETTSILTPPAAPPPAPTEGAKPPAEPVKAAAPAEGTAAAPATLATPPSAPAPLELKFPEGFKPDAEAVDWFKGIAAESGLKPEQAQKFIDFEVKRATAAAEKQKQAFDSYVKGNAEQVKKEWGPDYQKNADLAQKALADPRFPAGQKLLTLANELGLGTHPVLLNYLKEIGSALAEDRADRGGKAAAPVDDSREAQARQLYPKSPEMFQARR